MHAGERPAQVYQVGRDLERAGKLWSHTHAVVLLYDALRHEQISGYQLGLTLVVVFRPVAGLADEQPRLVVGDDVGGLVRQGQSLPGWVEVLVRTDVNLLGP